MPYFVFFVPSFSRLSIQTSLSAFGLSKTFSFVSWCKRTFYLFPYIGAAQKGMLSVYCFFISPAVIRKNQLGFASINGVVVNIRPVNES